MSALRKRDFSSYRVKPLVKYDYEGLSKIKVRYGSRSQLVGIAHSHSEGQRSRPGTNIIQN